MKRLFGLYVLAFLSLFQPALSQESGKQIIEVGESMQDYIRENHIGQIEDMVHQFASSKVFLNFLLEKGHNITPDDAKISRRDINVGDDLDVYVKHLTEHQNFTMIMVPVDIYSEMVYDTLLFSILEVSDQWLADKYRYHDLSDPQVREDLLTLENHDMLAKHMYEQGRDAKEIGIGEVQVQLRESYISSNSIHMHMSEFTKSEKKQFRKSWSLLKKALAHNVDLNVEMNVYIFGSGDMRLFYYTEGTEKEYRITPQNIFTRHKFLED